LMVRGKPQKINTTTFLWPLKTIKFLGSKCPELALVFQ
jgi:hypothetical protein